MRFFSICIFFLSAFSQSFGQNSYVDDRVKTFFEHIEDNEYKEALDYIYSDNKWVLAKTDEVNNLKAQFAGFGEIVGSFLSYDLLITEKFHNRIIIMQYMVSYERQPMRFEFQFYKSKDNWMIYSFSYNDDLDDWLEEKVKYKFLYEN